VSRCIKINTGTVAIAIAMILEEKPMIASQAIPKPMDNAT
jgi:hypothetical protein